MTLEEKIESKGLKVTANRLLVLRAISEQSHPVSFTELEDILITMDKSSVFRALTAFVEAHIVHTIEDGSGVLKYEVCGGEHNCSVEDMHVHFYCEKCKQSYCFPSLRIPGVILPEDYEVHSITYMVKGVCPKCKKRV